MLFRENTPGEELRHDWRFPGGPIDTTEWSTRGDCSANLGHFTDPPPDYEGGAISFGIVRRTHLDEPGLMVDTRHDLDSFRITVVPDFVRDGGPDAAASTCWMSRQDDSL